MDVHLEEFEMAIEGPLEASSLPAAVLVGVVFTFLHAGRAHALPALRSALERLGGPASQTAGWLRSTLEFRQPPLVAALGARKGRLAAGQRLKAPRVAELAEALRSVDGVHGVRLRARYRRFAPPGSRGGQPLDG